MKQNQSLYRPFPGESTQLKKHDYLKVNSNCQCQMCQKGIEPLNPQIRLDQKLTKLKKVSCDSMFLSSDKQKPKGLMWFLKNIWKQKKHYPEIPILDTIAMSNGQCLFYVSHDCHKWKFVSNSISIKNIILNKKDQIDLEYQKKRYIRENIGFGFAMLDHQSQKLIRQFQGKMKYTNSLLNRVAILKLKEGSKPKSKQKIMSMNMHRSTSFTPTPGSWSLPLKYDDPQDIVLTKYQFQNLFNKARTHFCELDQIEFIQVFPIMYNQEQYSYTKSIKYFKREQQFKSNFKLAQSYAQTWIDANLTMKQLQNQFIQSILHQKNKKKQQIQEEYLSYQTYKLFIFFEMTTNITINQALIQYITNDEGRTFYLKNIKYINQQQKHKIQQAQNKLPQKKQIQPQYYIKDLKGQMRQLYDTYQQNFCRLESEWNIYNQKWEADKKYSNQVFKSVTGNNDIDVNFHQVLKSNNLQYKQTMLKIGNGSSFNKKK